MDGRLCLNSLLISEGNWARVKPENGPEAAGLGPDAGVSLGEHLLFFRGVGRVRWS